MSATTISRIQVRAVVHPDPGGGYWAEIPDLPGCFTQGDSLDELLDNIVEAVAVHQDVKKSDVQVSALEMAP